MIKVVYGNSFVRSARILSKKIQVKLAGLLGALQEDPFCPLLHTKYLSGSLAGLLSFRITRDWRVIFKFLEADIIQLIEVAHRKDIYKK